MKLSDLKTALEPFAKFANMFEHHMATIPDRGEAFCKHELAVNGEATKYQLNVDDFFRAREALEFLNTLPEEPAIPPPAPIEPPVTAAPVEPEIKQKGK